MRTHPVDKLLNSIATSLLHVCRNLCVFTFVQYHEPILQTCSCLVLTHNILSFKKLILGLCFVRTGSETGGAPCFQVLYEMFTCVFWRPLLVRWERWVLHVNILCTVVSGDKILGGGGNFQSGGVDSLWNECHKYYIFSFTLQLWKCSLKWLFL